MWTGKHSFFNDRTLSMLVSLDQCAEYGIAFSADIMKSVARKNHDSEQPAPPMEVSAIMDKTFLTYMGIVRELLSEYVGLMDDAPSMCVLDYGRNGDEYECVSGFKEIPDAQADDLRRDELGTMRDVIFLQAGFYIKNHAMRLFENKPQMARYDTKGATDKYHGLTLANQYWLYVLGVVKKGGDVNRIADEFGLPQVIEATPVYNPATEKAVDLLKRQMKGLRPE